MGCWGTGLYSNDVAKDLKEDFRELARIPMDAGALVDHLCAGYAGSADPDDEDHANFWLVLADLLHSFGIEHGATKNRALDIIESGADIAMNRALDMSESDLVKRAAVLDSLRGRLLSPNPRPRDRKLFTKPQTPLMAAGDVWAYPTLNGNPLGCQDGDHVADAWNAFVVAAVDFRFGFYPFYFIARLHVFSPAMPTIEECRDAPLGWQEGPDIAFDKEFNPLPDPVTVVIKAGGWVHCDRPRLKQLQAIRIGDLAIDDHRLRPVYNAPDSRLGQMYSAELEPRRRYDGLLWKLFAHNFGGHPEYRPVPAPENLIDYLLPASR